MRPSYSVPKFLTKIWDLVEDSKTDDYICWSQDGGSFVVLDEERFAKELLPRYFKHNNMASFVRQLNWYGFHKVMHDESGSLRQEKYCSGKYQHAFFQRGHEELLINIKRKVPVPRMDENKSAPDDMHKILAFLHQLQGRQDAIDSTVEALKRENEALWKEVLQLRQKQYQNQPQSENESPSRSYNRMETVPTNQTLMIDNTGNYNNLAVAKTEPGTTNQTYENNSQWRINGNVTRGTKRAFHLRDDLDSTAEDSSTHLTSISLPHVFESYQPDDTDNLSDSSFSEIEEITNEDTSHEANQLPQNSKPSDRSKIKKIKMESKAEHQDSETEFIMDYSGSEDADENRAGSINSGHTRKRRKICRSSCCKMETMLKEMHKDNTSLTRRVLTLEQQSFEKLSEISAVLSNLASFIMHTDKMPKNVVLPSMTVDGKRMQHEETQTQRSKFQGKKQNES
ncbi:heat shock factor protein 2-like [Pelobates fuscus]|uniref:heat shock factor protein 2-like n=1 Tax=Pelobates fuscus TaxID=191477 RepID=UPI002FE4D3DA